MRVFSLFSGIGALDLGLEWAGMRTVGFCEIEPACRFWLREHWPTEPIFEDIRALTGETIRERCGPVDVVAGGFPWQDISSAGKGAGLAGARSGLWFEMLRIVRELRPRWIVAENVPALRTRGADIVLEGLGAEGYTCWPLVVGADDAGAPQRRKRVWLVAHAGHSQSKVGTRDDSIDGQRAPLGWRSEQSARTGAGGGVVGRHTTARAAESGLLAAEDAVGVGLANADSGGQPVQRERELLDGERAPSGNDADGRGERPMGDTNGDTVREQSRRSCGPQGQGAAEPGGPSVVVGNPARQGLALGVGVGSNARAERAAAERAGDAPGMADTGSGGCVAGLAGAHARKPNSSRCDPTLARGVVARPGERQHEWEAPRLANTDSAQRGLSAERIGGSSGSALQAARLAGGGSKGLADANDQGRQRPRSDAHEGRNGSTEDSGCEGSRESKSSVGDAAARTARRLARLATATRRARLRALGNAVYPQTVAAVGRAIMHVERSLNAAPKVD